MAILTTTRFSDLSADLRIDSEFYDPIYVKQDALLESFDYRPLRQHAEISDGNHVTIAEKFSEQGVRYLRGQDLSEFFVSDDVPVFVPEKVYRTLSRSHMHTGDVLLGIVGTIGSVSLVTNRHAKLTGNCKIAIIRPKTVPSEFLAIWLTSRFGQNDIRRAVRGSVQTGVILPDLRDLRIPEMPAAVVSQVVELVKAAERSWLDSTSLYPQAEGELLERLRWQRLAAREHELFYVERSSNVTAAQRCDAEHFQPQFRRLRRHLQTVGSATLGSFCPVLNRGVQPSFVDGGEVWVIDSKAVRPEGLKLTEGERTDNAFLKDPQNAKARIQSSDVLLNSTGRGTLGRATCYQSPQPAIADNHVTIIRPDDTVCLPVYLALYLNSPPGIAQSEMFQSGSSGQIELYPAHIARFLVFLPKNKSGEFDLKWQERLADLVLAGTAAKAKARSLLGEATSLVESQIENRT